MEQIITSLLDTDTYKISMQQALLELFPYANVEYRFKNRGKQRFNVSFLEELRYQITQMATISLSDIEYSWILEEIPFLKPSYVEYLKNYRFKPEEVKIALDVNNDLDLSIKGTWHSTILWEVPLMAIISELYFKMIDTDWEYNEENIINKAWNKINLLTANECFFVDFGTRRRRNYNTQNVINTVFKHYSPSVTIEPKIPNSFVGTSNVHFAMKHDLKPIGTMAHEWIMGMSVLESLRNSNYYALQNWVRVYNTNLGIALTDTYGSSSFFRNFNIRLAKLYDGVRHDSGNAFNFTNDVISHYKKFNIDPMSKTIVFSDGLNVSDVIAIKNYCKEKIKCSFGIGTHLTNDFDNSKALNMVIKLWSCEGVPVVKLSDSPGKVMGDPDAVRIAQWVFQNKPLDEK